MRVCAWCRGEGTDVSIVENIKRMIVALGSRTDVQTDGLTNGRTDGQTDGRTDGRTEGRTDVLANGRTDGRTNSERTLEGV